MVDTPINSKSTYFSDESNVFRLAVSTGNYLGFGRNSQIRRNDSFDSFEEMLRKARVANVDMLLLGGNLFDEHSPDQYILQRTMTCLKDHIFGDKPIGYEIVWGKNAPNYACENMNIDLPIFAIHGRKELAFGSDCNILEVLHAGNYVNGLNSL